MVRLPLRNLLLSSVLVVICLNGLTVVCGPFCSPLNKRLSVRLSPLVVLLTVSLRALVPRAMETGRRFPGCVLSR